MIRKINNFTRIYLNQSTDGESLETKIARKLRNNEPVETGGNDIIFTERKDGVLSAYDPRADKWDIALDATDVISKSITAKRSAKMEVVRDESTDGGEAENSSNNQ